MASKSVALITMSTRPTRIGPTVAEFVKKIVEKPLSEDGITIADVDLVKFNLPVFNEAVAPAMVPHKATFQHQHSRAWSAEISQHQGYILVIPEYNHGVSGGAKNAVDYLLNEWKGKPAAVVSYGVHGGATAGEQLNGALAGMGLRVVPTRPALAFAAPEVFAAVGGRLGEATLQAWEAERRGDVLRLAAELSALLLQPDEEEANVAAAKP
ncbi:hypothetical protein M426DRAFT_10207 [Hypoxylon sp. CI-4A]|nr:hypothetical protein M426DRAFT_10207 [Hypoxylon sp. CI-4A]